MKITYREENGCFYPNLKLPELTNYPIGKYGLLHLDFIKEYRKGRYTTLLSECRLNEYLHKIDIEATEMLENIIHSLVIQRGVDENLKARDMLRWVAEMNNIKSNVEEIVLKNTIYK